MDKYEIRRLNFISIIDSQFKGVTAAFARKIGKDASYIGRCLYEKGKKGKKNIGDEYVEAACTSLGLPPGWFDVTHDKNGITQLSALENYEIESKLSAYRQLKKAVDKVLPILSPEKAKCWRDSIDNFQYGTDEGMIDTSDKPTTPYTFIFRIVGDANADEFKDGEIAYIDPELEPKVGNWVLVEIGGDAVIRQLWREAGDLILRPGNAKYDPKPMVDAKIIGVVAYATQPPVVRTYI